VDTSGDSGPPLDASLDVGESSTEREDGSQVVPGLGGGGPGSCKRIDACSLVSLSEFVDAYGRPYSSEGYQAPNTPDNAFVACFATDQSMIPPPTAQIDISCNENGPEDAGALKDNDGRWTLSDVPGLGDAAWWTMPKPDASAGLVASLSIVQGSIEISVFATGPVGPGVDPEAAAISIGRLALGRLFSGEVADSGYLNPVGPEGGPPCKTYEGCSVLTLADVQGELGSSFSSAGINQGYVAPNGSYAEVGCEYATPTNGAAASLDMTCNSHDQLDPTAIANRWRAYGTVTPVDGVGEFAIWQEDVPDGGDDRLSQANRLIAVSGQVVLVFAQSQTNFPPDGQAKAIALMRTAIGRL
jgi:hypothetical protein